MKLKNYKPDLLAELKDPEIAAEYIAQALESGNHSVFLLAVRDVVEMLVYELIAVEAELRSNLSDMERIRLADKIHGVRRAMQEHAGLVLTHKQVEKLMRTERPVAEQMPAEKPADRVLKVVRDRQALPFLEIAALTGLRISVLTAVVNELAAKEMVKLYGPDDPSNRVVAVNGSYR